LAVELISILTELTEDGNEEGGGGREGVDGRGDHLATMVVTRAVVSSSFNESLSSMLVTSTKN
jgi:hypothetical protein